MKIVVHRGAHQIGGCVVEISTDKTRIFIDFGEELPGLDRTTPPSLMPIDGLTDGPKNCDAVFFTHYHGDHIGMLSHILPGVPLYMGEATKEIYLTYQRRIDRHIEIDTTWLRTFESAKTIQINDITVTPFTVDHSAYDAHMFLIEADGKRILHTGDFRTHGFRGKGVLPTLRKYVGQVDVLIIEGTNLYKDDEEIITEHQLQREAISMLSKYKYIFVICPSTNIDRIASFNMATPSGKYFFCDSYQKEVIEIAKRYGAGYSRLYSFEKVLTWGTNLREKAIAQGFVMMVRGNERFRSIMREFRDHHDTESLVIYSMWDGYLQQEGSVAKIMMEEFQNTIHLHTSGHATRQAIIDVCNTVRPTQAIIPIHTNRRETFSSLPIPYAIKYLEDGEVFNIFSLS